MKKTLKIISVNLLIFILLLIIAELLLHIVPPFDRFVTYYDAGVKGRNEGANKEYTYIGNEIGTISEFKVHIKNNSLGFHDSNHTFLNKADNYRILIIGDSQVEAVQVELPKTFFKILERKLNNEGFHVEVISLGKSGYGPKEALDLYKDIGRRFDPDLVIWSFTFNNDITDSYPEFQKMVHERKVNNISRIPDFLESSKIATFLYTRRWKQESNSLSVLRDTVLGDEFSYINKISNWDNLVFLKRWPSVIEQPWKSFEKYYVDLIEEIHNDGKEIITISTSGAYPDYLLRTNGNLDWDFDKPNQLVGEISEENSVKFLSMEAQYELFRKRTGEKIIFNNDGHLNEAGHKLVAETLFSEVKQLIINRNNNYVTNPKENRHNSLKENKAEK